MRSLKQQLVLLVIGPLVILSLLVSLVTANYIKNRAILATEIKALSDLATGEEILNLMYPGPWEAKNGVLYKGGVPLNNNFEVVDLIASLTGDSVTIFLGDTRVSTTVKKKDGERAVGTRVSKEVDTKVLRNGEVYLGEANVVGNLYRTAYKPIEDRNGKIIGMFYVGISEKLSSELIYKSLVTTIGISAVLTLIVGTAAWYFTQKVIIRPLQLITRSTREIAEGQKNKVEVSSNNEIGELAIAFNRMVEGLQGVAHHISRVTGNEPINVGSLEAVEVQFQQGEGINSQGTDNRGTDNQRNENQVTENQESEHHGTANHRIATVETPGYVPKDLPKGLNEATMRQIIAYIEEELTPMSAEEIGDGVNLTRVTARRYLEYLEQIGRVEVEQKYGTVGRPVKLYKAFHNVSGNRVK